MHFAIQKIIIIDCSFEVFVGADFLLREYLIYNIDLYENSASFASLLY